MQLDGFDRLNEQGTGDDGDSHMSAVSSPSWVLLRLGQPCPGARVGGVHDL